MRLALLLILVAIPLLELAVLIRAGQLIGVAPTLAIVVGTALLGLVVVRQQGFSIVSRAREAISSGRPPIMPVAEGALVLFAGGLLILPGLIGDAIGLVLLIPPVRRAIAAWSLGRFASEGASRLKVFTRSRRDRRAERRDDREPRQRKPGPIIEGEYTRIDEPKDDRRNSKS
ncbi:MAG: FxsA family protein [Hyphomicrobiaceae bacterium]|nr:FxsA family protein [Hyphomicrobiaceae bacterium]